MSEASTLNETKSTAPGGKTEVANPTTKATETKAAPVAQPTLGAPPMKRSPHPDVAVGDMVYYVTRTAICAGINDPMIQPAVVTGFYPDGEAYLQVQGRMPTTVTKSRRDEVGKVPQTWHKIPKGK